MKQPVEAKYIKSLLLSLLVIYGIFLACVIWIADAAPLVSITDDYIIIKGGHTRMIYTADIDSILLVDHVPNYITNKHSGNEKWKKGRFITNDSSYIHLHLSTLDPPIIKIIVKKDEASYISMRNTAKTRKLYQKMNKRIKS